MICKGTHPIAIELFAGYGGLAMAIEDVFEVETVAMSEIEPAAVEILGHRYPDAASLGDVTKVDWHRVARTFGPIDILGGGFPCTDISLAGARAGIASGTRSGLWSEFAAAIAVLRPRLVIVENVRGLLSAKASRGDADDPDLDPLSAFLEGNDAEATTDPSGGEVGFEDEDMGDDDGTGPVLLRALGAILGDLAGLGYDAAWHGLRAADVGAPHGRFRVFLVAWPAADPESVRHERSRAAWFGGHGSAHCRDLDADPDDAGCREHGGGRVRTGATLRR